MKTPRCERIALDDLADYTAGELPEAEAAAIEEHLFSCAACGPRAAEFDALVRAIPPAVRSAEVGGFVLKLAAVSVLVTWSRPSSGNAR